MGTWLTLAGVNAVALGAGLGFGPVYAAGGRARTWTLRAIFLLAAALEFLHLPSLAWFFVLWLSFGIGGRIRRRIEHRTPAPLNEDDPAATGIPDGHGKAEPLTPSVALRRGRAGTGDRPD